MGARQLSQALHTNQPISNLLVMLVLLVLLLLLLRSGTCMLTCGRAHGRLAASQSRRESPAQFKPAAAAAAAAAFRDLHADLWQGTWVPGSFPKPYIVTSPSQTCWCCCCFCLQGLAC
jgi:uncharacterized iron-regulated membrane protein